MKTHHSLTNQRHLDIGCGAKPRNPYQAQEIFGVDIRPDLSEIRNIEIRPADLFREPIPWSDNYFDSVSAYDFLEHVPRTSLSENKTTFPFINLMNEVWRVLKNNGCFYASTPAYPHPAAFQDPTHVNIITRQTHLYFTAPTLLASIYGFIGNFECIRVIPVRGGEFEYQPVSTPTLLNRIRLKNRERRNKNSHLIWEFKAIK
jgi:SAM-dependent methyltransferase